MSATAERIALIKDHALNELTYKPESVTAHDRLFLIAEIVRLRVALTMIREMPGTVGWVTYEMRRFAREAL